MYNKTEKVECTCDRCSHIWRSRTDTPKKCPSCGSFNWNSGTRKFTHIISRACGQEENRSFKFCILDYVDTPETTTDDVFYIREEDIDRYIKNQRMPGGSALVFIGDFEIGEDRNLIINELKLVYCHAAGFKQYISSVNCIYNIKSFYERKKAEKLRQEEAERNAILEEEQKRNRIEAAQRKLQTEAEKQNRLEIAKQKLADESIPLDERLKYLAELEQQV